MNNRSDLLNQFKEWNEFVLEIIDLDWNTPIDEGKWTIHDVVSHIMLWDKYFYETTIEPIARDKTITLELIDFDFFNKNAVTYGMTKTKDELKESTVKYRNLILDCISSLDEVKYSQEFVDGRFSLESYLKDFISHDRHHMMQIEELKGKL
ncbi:DinB superfamily protein [compost metagenome]